MQKLDKFTCLFFLSIDVTREVMLSPSEGRLSLNSLLFIFPMTSSAKLIKIKSSPIELTGPVNSVPFGLFLANVSNLSSDKLFNA